MGPPAGDRSFEFVDDVTSDVSFVARGASLPDVFAAAADALLGATVEQPESIRALETRRIALAEPDVELLLLRFLNELVYLRDAEGLLLRARALRVDPGAPGRDARLEAELVGERLDRDRHRTVSEVKAATAHRLSLVADADADADAGGFRATVTLDV